MNSKNNFDKMVERISPRLRYISRKLNTRFSYFDEDDLYQEALIYLWKKFGCHELEDKTDSYILQGCFFFMKNYIRVSYKNIDHYSSSIDTVINTRGDMLSDKIPASRASDQYAFMVVDILVEDILTCLTKREEKIFLMALEDMTTRQIGERLGISHVAVVKIERKIRQKCAAFKKEI